jgi:hypothetical protein
MATMNFSIPDDLKDAFNATFGDRNKSAIVARLMREAIKRERQRERALDAAEAILRNQIDAPTTTDEAIRRLRHAGRP